MLALTLETPDLCSRATRPLALEQAGDSDGGLHVL